MLGKTEGRKRSWLSFPSPGDLLDPGMKSVSPSLQADSLLLCYNVNKHKTFLISEISIIFEK